MKAIKYYFFILIILIPFCGCAPTVSQELNYLDEQNYFVPSNVVLDDIKLSKDDIPDGYEFGEEPLSYSIQVNLFHQDPNMLFRGATCIEKEFQTIIGNNRGGSIYYFKFDKPLSSTMQESIKRIIYGPEMQPSIVHPEQIYMNNKIMLIWAFKKNSEIMKISQNKLINYLDNMNTSNVYGWSVDDIDTGKGQFYDPECGKIQFYFPDSWNTKSEKSKNGIYTITFEPTKINSFSFMLDPQCTLKWDLLKAKSIKQQVERRGNELLQYSLEKELKLKELVGTSSTGYYYSLEDKSPKSGEWKYMTQGKIEVGSYILHFTIFTQSLQIKEIDETLSMLRSAEHANE